MEVIELGCGTAYVSAWLARRGARPTGIDNSAEQLSTARSLQDEHDLHFPLIHGNAEATGLPDASFDLAVSEYGASIWADPYCWIPEAARLLRPGGELVFLTNGTLWILTVSDTEEEGIGDGAPPAVLFRHASLRVAGGPRRRVPPRLRRLGPPAPGERIRGDRLHRGAGAGRGDRQCSRPRRSGMGAKVACRADLEGPQRQQRRLGSHRRTCSPAPLTRTVISGSGSDEYAVQALFRPFSEEFMVAASHGFEP
jgi:SAM-dependent methyltransferase